MTQKIKDSYQTPAVKVLEVHFERFVCQTSPGDNQAGVPGYGDDTEI